MSDILFLLWIFVIPFFTVSHQLFKAFSVHKRQPLLEIILATTFMALIWAGIGCGWGMMLLGTVSESLLLRCVLGNVVFSGVTLLYLGAQSFPNPFKKLLFVLFAVFNLFTVFTGLLDSSFSGVVLIVILLTYPVLSVYHFLLSYVAKEIK